MIRLNLPFTDHRELQEISSVLESGFLTQGPRTHEFERKVAELVGCRYAFAMSSCTTALHLSLVALGIKAGDEVLVADFTFPATANVVVQQGAVPVFVDIDLDTFTVDPDDLRAKVTNRTRAMIPVHAFGCSADMDPILQVAAEHGIAVIEDAACAIGATYKDRYCGNLGDVGCFSFHPRKVITTGEGGMITTERSDLAERVELLRSHGGVPDGPRYRYEAAGYNYRLSDIHGAIGVIQMDKLPTVIERKRRLARLLRERLAPLEGVRPPLEPAWDGHIYQSFVILLDDWLDRDSVIDYLRNHGVESTLGTYAMHDQPFYQQLLGYRTGQLPNSHAAFMRSITLPLYPQMQDADLDTIATQLRAAILLQAQDLGS